MTARIDLWPERTRFRELVDAWMEARPGKSKGDLREDLAAEIGMTPEYLRQLYSGKVKAPGRDMLRKMADVLGCKVSDLLQDTDPVLELDSRETADYSVEEQFDLRALGTNLKRLTPDARARVIKAWRAVLESSVPTKASIEIKVTKAKPDEGPNRSRG